MTDEEDEVISTRELLEACGWRLVRVVTEGKAQAGIWEKKGVGRMRTSKAVEWEFERWRQEAVKVRGGGA